MTNAMTKKSHAESARSVWRAFHPTTLAAACSILLGLGAAGSALAAASVVSVSNGDLAGSDYVFEDTVTIAVKLSGEIQSVTLDGAKKPYLTVDLLNAGNTATSSDRYAYYTEFDGDTLYFEYAVKGGDFTEDLEIRTGGFALNGAIITVADGAGTANLTRAQAQAIPTGGAANSLSANADITIRTIEADGQTTFSGAEGGSESVTITRGQAWNRAQSFSVTASADGFLSFPATFAIPANAMSAAFAFTYVSATNDAVTINLHPDNYGASTAGDIVLTI